ncbi:MAG TPA: DUF4097 family beta strand repeat-containing protein [Anaerolineales bacterium]|nr:DUF4097 family beta strand repeat-containing protein [Anaerolineales bacterium]
MKRPLIIGLLVVALLFVLAGISAVAFFAIRRSDFAIFDVPLVSATAEESKILEVDAENPVTLKVDDDAGDVSVLGRDVEAVEIRIVKTGYATTQARAEEALENIHVEVRQNGNAITLIYKLSGRQTHEVNTVDLIVTVPTETAVEIDNGFGTIDVSDLKGNVDISSDFGDVTVTNIEGALALDNSSGTIKINGVDAGAQDVKIEADFGSISLDKVNGRDITVNSSSGTLDLADVRATGNLSAGSDFGSIIFENGSAASVTVDSSSGRVALTKVTLRGTLIITCGFGDIELNQVSAGSYDLDSNSGAITMDSAKNKIKAHTDFGTITVENAQNATLDLRTNSGGIEFSGSLGEGPHSLHSDFGSIDIAIPADSALNVDLDTDFGSISSDIPITVTLDGSQENQQEGTMNGGGAELTVKTRNGSISITAIK